jgi:multiple sugar transport system permease protein
MALSLKTQRSVITFLMLTPAVLLIAVFFVGPAAVTFYYSLTDMAMAGSKALHWSFVGLDNYQTLLQDENFWASLLNSLILLIFSGVIGQQVLGFYMAYLMQKKPAWLRAIVGGSLILAWVAPEIVAAFLFYALYNTDGGINAFLGLFGLEGAPWLLEWGMPALIVANIWRGTAFSMLMFQSAFDQISDSMLEAAIIDGARRSQVLFKVILPSMRNAIATNTVLVTLQTLGLFGLIYALTGGGPGYDTTTLPLYMYKTAIVNFQLSYGVATSIMLLLVGMALSFVYMKLFRGEG